MRNALRMLSLVLLASSAIGCGGEKTVIRKETVETSVPAAPVIERRTTVETAPVVEERTTIKSGTTTERRSTTVETED